MEETIINHLGQIITVIINVVLVVAAYYKLVNKVDGNEKTLKEIEHNRESNVKALREIYDGKIQDSKNYAKALFEQKSDALMNLQQKVDKIETRLESMATQKSVDELGATLSKIIGLIIDKKSKDNEIY